MPTPDLPVSPYTTGEYLAAFEAALERVPATLRHREMDALREELSWLDSRGSAILLAARGTPEAAARAIHIRKIAGDELRMRRAAVVIIGVSAGIVGIAVTAFRRFLRTNCSCRHEPGPPRTR